MNHRPTPSYRRRPSAVSSLSPRLPYRACPVLPSVFATKIENDNTINVRQFEFQNLFDKWSETHFELIDGTKTKSTESKNDYLIHEA